MKQPTIHKATLEEAKRRFGEPIKIYLAPTVKLQIEANAKLLGYPSVEAYMQVVLAKILQVATEDAGTFQ